MARTGYDNVGVSRPQPFSEDPQRLDPAALSVGVRLDASALEIPLGAAVKLENCRFEEKGIRKDFGYTAIGDGAVSRVLGLAEHKFIDSGELFHRLVRILRNPDNFIELYAWDGTDWVLVDDTTDSLETIQDKKLVMFSTQNKLVFTEGTQIMQWGEVPVLNTIEHDFPSGNSLTAVDQQVDVTIADDEAFDGVYTLHYSVSISGTADDDKVLTLGFYHEGTKVDDRVYVSPAGSASDTWTHETIDLLRPSLVDGDVLSIKIESLEAPNPTVEDAFGPGDATVSNIATKSVAAESSGDVYNYDYQVILIPWGGVGAKPSMTIGLYRDNGDGAGWVKERESTFTNVSDSQQVNNVVEGLSIPNMSAGDKWGLKVESNTHGSNQFTANKIFYDTGVSVDVQGFNKGVDVDPAAGATHDKRTGTTSDLSLLSPDAPAATFIFPFGDRLLALQDDGNPQLLSWSADGDITDWTGTGSGATSLLDARSDALDDLMALGAVSSNVAVLFRKRSMMRVQETGNPLLAISATHWIEGIGTESPLTVKQVRGGLMFLGHDLMVYYFNGSAEPIAVGRPIHRELIEDIGEQNVEEIEGVFDPVFGEYWLKAPSRVWVFDVAEFIETQNLKWRSKDIRPQRMTVVSRIT